MVWTTWPDADFYIHCQGAKAIKPKEPPNAFFSHQMHTPSKVALHCVFCINLAPIPNYTSPYLCICGKCLFKDFVGIVYLLNSFPTRARRHSSVEFHIEPLTCVIDWFCFSLASKYQSQTLHTD